MMYQSFRKKLMLRNRHAEWSPR